MLDMLKKPHTLFLFLSGVLILHLFSAKTKLLADPSDSSQLLSDTSIPYPSDWITHAVCEDFCIEVLELESSTTKTEKSPVDGAPLLLIPGFFQNARSFDLLPEKGASFARYLQKKLKSPLYVLHVRGIGRSPYPEGTELTLDKIASQDIPLAVDYLKEKHKKKSILIGHSQGAITSQAFLAGLKKCKNDFCFSKKEALARQKNVVVAGLIAGNVAMNRSSKKNPLKEFVSSVQWLIPALELTFDRVPAYWLTQYISPTKRKWPLIQPLAGEQSVAFFDLWELVYHIPNVSFEARKALYDLTLDASSTNIMAQFKEAVLGGGVRTKNGEYYSDHLKNIQLPVVQQVFKKDPLAEWKSTRDENFKRLGSSKKSFFAIENQGHEDFMMDKKYLKDFDPWVSKLIGYYQSEKRPFDSAMKQVRSF